MSRQRVDGTHRRGGFFDTGPAEVPFDGTGHCGCVERTIADHGDVDSAVRLTYLILHDRRELHQRGIDHQRVHFDASVPKDVRDSPVDLRAQVPAAIERRVADETI